MSRINAARNSNFFHHEGHEEHEENHSVSLDLILEEVKMPINYTKSQRTQRRPNKVPDITTPNELFVSLCEIPNPHTKTQRRLEITSTWAY